MLQRCVFGTADDPLLAIEGIVTDTAKSALIAIFHNWIK
jgi:hypothetical protein